MPTSLSRDKLEERNAPRSLLPKKTDRLGMSAFFKYARGFTFAVMFAAYVGQQTQDGTAHLSNLIVGVAEKSFLSSSWVFLYFLLVWVIVKQNWKRFLHYFQDLPGATNRGTEGEDSLLERVSSSETISKIRSSMRLFSASHAKLPSEGRYQAISAQDSFLEKGIIADLALGDVKELFTYSIECNMAGFTRSSFVSRLRPAARNAIDAIDSASQASRGPDVKRSKASGSWDYGEVDALVFMAVVRIFAEWRNLRLVPDGYQRYAVGMNLARRDLLQNVNKMEMAAHVWLSYHEGSNSPALDLTTGVNMASPTLRELLQHEVDQKMHTQLPRLKGNSAASGFLWTNRQLHYQTAIFTNTIQIPILFPTSKAAVTAAYKQVYDNYHGFFVKAIFQNSFDAAPEHDVILNFMSIPNMLDDDALTEPSSGEDDDECDSWVQIPVDAEPSRHHEQWTEEPTKNPLEEFGNHLTLEWAKFQGFWDQCGGANMNRQPSRNAMHVGCTNEMKPISEQASRAVQDDIPSYMNILRPFLLGLDGLIDEMNINDPTKV